MPPVRHAHCKRINLYQLGFILDQQLWLYNSLKPKNAVWRSLKYLFLYLWNELNSCSESAGFHSTILRRKKIIFLTELSVPCGSPGLAIYRVPACKPESCMVAAGPLFSFLQASDHKQCNFTMVTSFIPTASLAPTIQDSWHSFYPMQFPMQFEHADQLLFISHSVLVRRKALYSEKNGAGKHRCQTSTRNKHYDSILND